MPRLKEFLKNLDFSERESRVYLALLEAGSARASEISDKTDINRTTVYDILGALLHRGLISKYKKGASTFFNALEPKRLLTYLDNELEEKTKIIKQQKKQVDDLLPELISLENVSTNKPRVSFFEGEKGMREAYEDTLTSKEIILAYANVQTMHEGLPKFFPEYYKRRAKNKIFIKTILPLNDLSIQRSKFDLEEMRETRFLLDKEMTFSPEINLYNNKMLIASWKEKMAIIIESKELVDLQKLTFNLLWNNLKKHN
ncbi:MAG: helix-turn-helix domain-containing protein [Candidatus Komeilibacteria bacterium]|jgi:sugar-specific transcriptional regulator TrmB|nr:helix-turn-helix domain-containing protein [Candidatus Komeilibacteria bacterium]MBT4447553.1 helix-turn-helix domain-containing protein [Candidatus Komeilibacteria bacterium]